LATQKHLADAHRPAQDAADKTRLPQTVFYHPDHAFSWTNSGAGVLRDKQTMVRVTWLPSNFFQ
jgi:hypothetical protein